jgi:hypothetical protein
MITSLSLALIAVISSVVADEQLMLFVAFAPSYFSGEGAVVSVDATSGAWTIVKSRIKLHGVFGDPALASPSYAFDSSTNLLYLQHRNAFGLTAVVDMKTGRDVGHFGHRDPFFVGFTSFAVDDGKRLVGTSPVGNDDGTFSFGEEQLAPPHSYRNESLLLFKALMDDSQLLDNTTNSYYCQADYNQRANGLCQGGEELCLLEIDSNTGKLRSVIETNFTIYKYAHDANRHKALAFVEGSEGRCPRGSGGDFLFAEIDLTTGASELISCWPKAAFVQEDEWVGSFSHSRALFATGSRFSDTTQLLVVDVASGAILLNSQLPGLASALHAIDGLYSIWAVEFVK